ncbi:hypothetical protein HY524_01045 [Candidatus Berkelbacteria bacterium]|nr:hypothetical protein [Candidatus Berkelbacteria bacterium]
MNYYEVSKRTESTPSGVLQGDTDPIPLAELQNPEAMATTELLAAAGAHHSISTGQATVVPELGPLAVVSPVRAGAVRINPKSLIHQQKNGMIEAAALEALLGFD